jgi:hypothetical protein
MNRPRKVQPSLVLLRGGRSVQGGQDADWSRFCAQIGWQAEPAALADDYEDQLLGQLFGGSQRDKAQPRAVVSATPPLEAGEWQRRSGAFKVRRSRAGSTAMAIALLAVAACFAVVWVSRPVGLAEKARPNFEGLPAFTAPERPHQAPLEPAPEPSVPNVTTPQPTPDAPVAPNSGALLAQVRPRAASQPRPQRELGTQREAAEVEPVSVAAVSADVARPTEAPTTTAAVVPREWRQPVANEAWEAPVLPHVASSTSDWSLLPSTQRWYGVSLPPPATAGQDSGIGVMAQLDLAVIGRL